MILKTRIHDIPCKVRVTHFHDQPALGPSASNDRDCYGYTEIAFDVLDMRGRPASWLERKMDDCDTRAVEQEIIAAKQQEKQQVLEDRAEERHVFGELA